MKGSWNSSYCLTFDLLLSFHPPSWKVMSNFSYKHGLKHCFLIDGSQDGVPLQISSGIDKFRTDCESCGGGGSMLKLKYRFRF